MGFILAACLGSAAQAQGRAGPEPPSEAAVRYGAVVDDLGGRLLSRLTAPEPTRTVLLSPLSVSAALTLVAQGAKGRSAAGFEAGLRLAAHDLSVVDAANAYENIARGFGPSTSGRTLRLATGVWADEGIKLVPAFVETAKRDFEAHADTVDFAAPQTLAQINQAVSDATGGKIASLLRSSPPKGGVVLINALYFKADWFEAFDRANTQARPFTGADGVMAKVPMMRRSGDYDYLETDAYQAVALPYRDRRFELLVVLPRPHRDLGPGGLAAVDRRAFLSRPGEVSLPRLHLQFQGDLLTALRKEDFGAALQNDADFSGMTPQPAAIGQILHAAVLDVDETGSEGAAATAVISMRSVARPPPPFTLVVDRPFYLVLRERLTGADLFLSYVAAPGTESEGPKGGGA